MVFDTIGRYEFDTLWIWGCDFDMVLCFWYGLGYGLDMVLDVIDTVLIWFQWVGFKKRNRNTPGTGFWPIFRRFLWFYVLIWCWYDFDTILTRFWYDFDTILIRFWYDFDTVLIWFQRVGFKKRNRNNPGTGFWSILRRFFCGFDMILTWFWCYFDTILICFWYDFDMLLDMVPMGWLQITILTHIKNHNWNHIRFISKTVSTS